MLTIFDRINHFRKSKFYKYGLPFLVLVVAGSFGLKEFTSLRFQYLNRQKVTPADMEKFGVTMKKAEDVTLDTEYDKVKNLDIENWENIRGPRPWEEQFSNEEQPAVK